MGEGIYLRQARIALVRNLAALASTEARALHGRTKAQRKLEKAEADKLDRAVDQAKLASPTSEE